MITLPSLVVSSRKQVIYLYLRLSVRVRILVTRTYMSWFNFYPWFKFYFPLFWGVVMYANESKTKENKI